MGPHLLQVAESAAEGLGIEFELGGQRVLLDPLAPGQGVQDHHPQTGHIRRLRRGRPMRRLPPLQLRGGEPDRPGHLPCVWRRPGPPQGAGTGGSRRRGPPAGPPGGTRAGPASSGPASPPQARPQAAGSLRARLSQRPHAAPRRTGPVRRSQATVRGVPSFTSSLSPVSCFCPVSVPVPRPRAGVTFIILFSLFFRVRLSFRLGSPHR